ncbi:alpha/beta hydrolase [Spirosoma sp. BT702]|uniref:Alpha/beta hydrolase n=1 Tax=Spirosoma profusum TaxID=2771354 RepID=A0A927AW67_9BACT|nr:alpha/beta hydrolase [Spirosoma profusum]MBD2705496.1 alpha/beta hydrolase [Spirosoma profusum]
MNRIVSATFILLAVILGGCARQKFISTALTSIMANTTVISNICYAKAGQTNLYLDAYIPAKQLGQDPWIELSEKRKPTLLYFHGGGWSSGDKLSRSLLLLPYLEKGWCVVTADYRLLGPGSNVVNCIRDCRSALGWVYANAATYKFDTTCIVLSGESAGAHLALMAGGATNDQLLQADSGFAAPPKAVSAVINWYGITDVEKAVTFWNNPAYTKLITGDEEPTSQFFQQVSPIHYVTQKTPPVLSIHGDQDINVPIAQSETYHSALVKMGVVNKLIRIPGKKHGNFSSSEFARVFDQIFQFLESIWSNR